MFAAFEGNVHPDHLDQERRLFIVEGIETERYKQLISGVMGVYAAVTGKIYTRSHIVEYPAHIVDELEVNRFFDFRFGIPNLKEPAHTHGKFAGKLTRVYAGETVLKGVGFWVDTNDSDAQTPIPKPSQDLKEKFDTELRVFADSEFADIVVPTAYRIESHTSHDLSRAVPNFSAM